MARLGGDEFGLLLPELPERDSALLAAARMARDSRRPFSHDDATLPIDAGIGLAMFPEDASDTDDLPEEADRAMSLATRPRTTRRG